MTKGVGGGGGGTRETRELIRGMNSTRGERKSERKEMNDKTGVKRVLPSKGPVLRPHGMSM